MADIRVSGEYRGFKVVANSYMDGFTASSAKDDSVRADTLEKLKQKIDNIARKDFERTDILLDTRNGVLNGVVTSHVDKDHIWVSCDGSRMKQNREIVYLNNPQNLHKLRILKEKRESLDAFRKKIQTELKEIIETLECYDL